MNKLKYSLILLLFCHFVQGQTDTSRINQPRPDAPSQGNEQLPDNSNSNPVNTTTTNPAPAPTPTNTPPEKNRKRPKAYDDYVKGKRPSTNTPPFTDNIYYGCNLQLGYYAASGGNILYYDISPHAGYKFNEYLSAGVQIIYNNQRYSSGLTHINYDIFGIGGFGRVLLLGRFFLQAEIDALSVPGSFRGPTGGRLPTEEKMAGIGYKSPLGDKLSYFFVLLYDFQPGTYSPYLYNPLIYRAGLSWNF